MLLNEHWLKTSEPFNLDKYNVIARFCWDVYSHGGTLILVNSNVCNVYDFRPIDNFNNLCMEKEFEFSLVYSKILNLYVVCLYRSPNSNCDIFFVSLERLLGYLRTGASVIIAGDFNINF